jgi:beta-lactamase superfamily II metal-dependent hydrolase
VLLLALVVAAATAQAPTMTAHFINVGQAHSTLLEFPCGAILIDAGSDGDHRGSVVSYLERFFARRGDLNRTIDAVFITHNHIDHTAELRSVVETFNVERYFDDGWTTGSGRFGPNWLRGEVEAGARGTLVRGIREEEVAASNSPDGLTDGEIDPLDCPAGARGDAIDPEIHVLQGSPEENPGWTESAFGNQNNHSLVIRVDYDRASFLFIGDLEEEGIEALLDKYGTSFRSAINTDILQVGHHGSHNATTATLLGTVSPQAAVIPMGRWNAGASTSSRFTTFAFGHPREVAVNLLVDAIRRRRPQPKRVMVATGARSFHEVTIRNAVYATGWDGTVRVVANPRGTFRIYRER